MAHALTHAHFSLKNGSKLVKNTYQIFLKLFPRKHKWLECFSTGKRNNQISTISGQVFQFTLPAFTYL